MKIQLVHSFEDIVSVDNLLLAWQEFIKGKRKKKDVQQFQFNFMDNIFSLHSDLTGLTYQHGGYQAFNISDPKPRNIHKASVRDRLFHHAIYRILYPFFNRTFIADSFSCRKGKGTHRALNRFRSFAYKVSQNHSQTCWVLKCDIRKFFASIDHETLLKILDGYIPNKNIIWLLSQVISSFETKPSVGLPLGNLTSQMLVNIYMNEFDQFMKHKLKVRHYIRYADDFVILSENKKWLENLIPQIRIFLEHKLKLSLHPDKVSVKTLASGLDFLGWVHFMDYRVLRMATRRRMVKRMEENPRPEAVSSYFGLLGWGNAHKLKTKIPQQIVLC